jgi:hypothetical protein
MPATDEGTCRTPQAMSRNGTTFPITPNHRNQSHLRPGIAASRPHPSAASPKRPTASAPTPIRPAATQTGDSVSTAALVKAKDEPQTPTRNRRAAHSSGPRRFGMGRKRSGTATCCRAELKRAGLTETPVSFITRWFYNR